MTTRDVAAPVDRTIPAGRWEFDADVTDVFDNMLERSIPQYAVMRAAVYQVGRVFVKRKTAVVDLGCSRGEALVPFIDEFGAQCQFVGVEVSEPMLAAARERFASLITAHVVEIRSMDLRQHFPPVQASLVLSVLTLQFTPIEYRQQILRRVYDHLLPGGAFILVEKVLGNSAELDDLMTGLYYDLKRANGYSQEQIERKRLSLEGALVPMTASFNEQLMRQAGFAEVDCFWRWQNFAGWVAIKR